MKRPVLHGTVALTLTCASSLFAQDLSRANRQYDNGMASATPVSAKGINTGTPIQPLLGVSPDSYCKDQPCYLIQDQASLGYSAAPMVTRPLSLESQLRSNATPFLKAATTASDAQPFAMLSAASHTSGKELNFALALLSAMYRADSAPSKDKEPTGTDLEYSLNIRHRIHEEPKKLLEIVAEEVDAHHDRVCEIVKAAIKAVDGNIDQIGQIVETAATTQPEAMRLAAQCAVAAVPESLQTVQAVLSKLDPASGNLGNGSKDAKDCKDAKDSKDAKTPIQVGPAITPPNPLDLPPPPPPVPPIPPPPPPATNTSFRHHTE